MRFSRRAFLDLAGAAVVRPIARAPAAQRLHDDFRTDLPGAEYFVLGNGRILAALQSCGETSGGTHCGLLVMSPEHFTRKSGTFLYHPERGLKHSLAAVAVNGVECFPEPGQSEVKWEYPDAIPTVALSWSAAGCRIAERLWCPAEIPALIRELTVENLAGGTVDVAIRQRLTANPLLFDSYEVDRSRGVLAAIGYHVMTLFALQEAAASDRHLEVRAPALAPGERATATFVLLVDERRDSFLATGLEQLRRETARACGRRGSLETGHAGLDHLFRCAQSGLRAAVARSGKMDGGIWQYNLEWVRDQTMAAIGAALTGQPEVAGSIFERILTRSVGTDGNTVEASRYRPPETMELDQNGELLYGLRTHWVWSGDDSLIRRHWHKIRLVADYVLQPRFGFDETGLVKNSREFWERDPAFGVLEGYELAYQVWNIMGLRAASEMAELVADEAPGVRWRHAAQRMLASLTGHPRFSLIENGRFIKRRLAGGGVQMTLEPPDRRALPPGMPLREEPVSYCDPDTTLALPLALELVDPGSELASRTLDHLEKLWNQRWTSGGYGRYDVSSEPDSPGAWPFATLFVARADLEAGRHERVWRALDWLLHIPGGRAGAWLEFYGERPTPPLLPVGIVPWTWAELALFFVHHLLGVRPSPAVLRIRPRLLHGLEQVNARVSVRGHSVHLTVKRVPGESRATVDGQSARLVQGAVELPAPRQDVAVEIHLGA